MGTNVRLKINFKTWWIWLRKRFLPSSYAYKLYVTFMSAVSEEHMSKCSHVS